MKLLTPDELEAALRDIGARRYHRLHPFHKLLHSGKCTKGQVQAWALNRYYYQAMIPIKDASLIAAAATTRRSAANGARASPITTAMARTTAASRGGSGSPMAWVSTATTSPRCAGCCRERASPWRLTCASCARKSLLEAIASSLTELFSPQIITERVEGMLASYSFVTRETLAYFDKRPPQAKKDSDFALGNTARRTRARPSSSSRCWRRWSSNAACCGRCATRFSTPMSIPKKYRPARSRRAADGAQGFGYVTSPWDTSQSSASSNPAAPWPRVRSAYRRRNPSLARDEGATVWSGCSLREKGSLLLRSSATTLRTIGHHSFSSLRVNCAGLLRRVDRAYRCRARWNRSITSGIGDDRRGRSALSFWTIGVWHARRHHHHDPAARHHARHGLADRVGRSGRFGRRFSERDAQEPDAAVLGSRRQAGEALEHDRDAARHHVVDRHRGAGRMHERDVGLGALRGTARRSDATGRRDWSPRTACRPGSRWRA